ncbi:MAG TPA: hypothetical protein VGK10_11720 [Prolixibacteraceae bacterium]|jgi:REP element-mobilizing transposase RayT
MPPRNFRIKIEPDKYYHIWNQGNNRDNLFYSSHNYEYFIRLYAEHLDPVVETYAFCLLPNHFHLLVRTKYWVQQNDETTQKEKMNPVSLAFQRFFAAYSQAINVQERRTGSLFQKPFKRLELTSPSQLAYLVFYIHANPQKHGIVEDFRQYPWSSYERVLRDRPSKLNKEAVLGWFQDKENYIAYHAGRSDLDDLKDLMYE